MTLRVAVRRSGTVLNACPALVVFLFLHTLVCASTAQTGSKPAAIVLRSGGGDGKNEHMLLLGAVSGSRWIQDRIAKKSLRGGETYRFYSLFKPEGESTGGKPELSEANGAAWELPFAKPPAGKAAMVGILGTRNYQPRAPRPLAPDQPVYLDAVAAVLKQHGLPNAKPHINTIVRVDLEGKGTDTVLIEAGTPGLQFIGSEFKQGEYSFVMARTLQGGVVRTNVLFGSFHTASGSSKEGDNICQLVGVLDLDGDGREEVIVGWTYYEGGGANVYRLKAGKFVKALEASDGA